MNRGGDVDTTDALAGDLATVTDEEWRAAHERLMLDLLDVSHPDEDDALMRQMTYVWSPGAPAREGGFEPDIAPPAGQWDGRLRDGE